MNYYNQIIPKLLHVNAIVLFRRIFYAMPEHEVSVRLRRHEEEHRRQQKRHGFFFFVVRYVLEYFLNFLRYWDFYDAYYHISYERQARAAERG